MVPPSGIASVGTEKSPVVQSVESHGKIISLRIHRVFQVFYGPCSRTVLLGLEQVQAAQADVSVGGKIQISVRTERREHFIPRSIDGFAEIIHSA